MTSLGLELGSLAEWAAAVAAAVGVLLSIFALKGARDANKTAERTRQEAADAREEAARKAEKRDRAQEERQKAVDAKEHERDRREEERIVREQERDSRLLAGAVQAWWTAEHSDADDAKAQWGVLVCNETLAGSVFHDVVINVKGNRASDSLKIETLPPGRYFVASRADGWAFPQLPSEEKLEPILRSSNHTIKSIAFTDPAGKRRIWSPEHGIQTVNPENDEGAELQ